MKEWIFTFGFGQTDPRNGDSLANHFVRIEADSAEEARQKMLATFGQKWGFQYASPEEAGVEKYHLIELVWTHSPPNDYAF